MAHLPESQTYDEGVYQIELADPVIGGPDGTSNKPLRNLANRTNWLKAQIEAIPGQTSGIANAEVVAHEAAANPHPQYATDADLAAHASAADPHPQYETSAEAAAKITAHEAAANPHPQYATDADLAAHASAADPHPQYETSAEAAAKITAHKAETDPHPQYETSAEAAAKITAHEAAANPHPQYATDADLAAHASAADPHPQYETSAEAAAKINAHASAPDPHPQYATDAELALRAPLASPAFTDNPTAPTPAQFNNGPAIATTAFVRGELGNMRGSTFASGNITLTSVQVGQLVFCNSSGAAYTITLPLLSSLRDGCVIDFASRSQATVSIAPQGSDHIYPSFGAVGAPSITLGNGDSAKLVVIGGSWSLVSGSASLRYNNNDFGKSLSANGWQRLPSGLIIQWGFYNGPSGQYSLNFPVAFPSTCFNVSTTPYQPTTTGNFGNQWVGGYSIAGFSGNKDSAASIFWTAIGF